MNGTWNQHTSIFQSNTYPIAEPKKEEWKTRALEERNHREKESVLNIQCLISNLFQLTSNLARRWISGRQTSLAWEKPIPTAFPSHRWTGSPRLALWVMAHRQSAVLPDQIQSCMSTLLSADRKHIQSVPIYSPLALQYGSQLVHSCSALPQLMERGEIEESRQGKKAKGKNILYTSSAVNVRSADADQPMSVSICNNTRKLHNAPLII